ncbi:hypothetical protein WME89_18230 [Sorangium sp. So ce321]|uniref:hypothetical protein n=1 Tax=Sorangium sp. So ce321 TaxID=3133300 RepID=UPI003F6172BB
MICAVLRKLEARALPPRGGLAAGVTADDLAQGGKIYYRSCTGWLTYVRSSWGNSAPPITRDEVARVRASLDDRQAPWAGGAELAAARATRVLP